tara:strand:+ start:8196 stop:10988 length:2793 start_codon:yes stop_codon:yes gene_type:complete
MNGGKCPQENIHVENQPCNIDVCSREPKTLNGYSDDGEAGFGIKCGGTHRGGTKAINDGEEGYTVTSFDDPYYHKYQRRAAFMCNQDDGCDYVSVSKDGNYHKYSAGECDPKYRKTDDNTVTWKKVDNTVAKRDVALKNFTSATHKIDGYTSLINPERKPPSWRGWRALNDSDTDYRCETTEYPKFGPQYGRAVSDRGEGVDLNSDEYKKYVQANIEFCEKEHDCNFLEVDKYGRGKMFSKCEGRKIPSTGTRVWSNYRKLYKRDDDQNGKPERPQPPPEIGEGVGTNSEKHQVSFMGYDPVWVGNTCQGTALETSYLREEGEDKVDKADFFSHKYQKLLKRAIQKCNEDKYCKRIELNHEYSIGKTFSECRDKGDNSTYVKVWEKADWVDPDLQGPVFGYSQYGKSHQTCASTKPYPEQSGWIKDGSVGDGNNALSTVKADGTFNENYKKYLEKGVRICNDDPNCKYLTMFGDGYYRTFSGEVCEDKSLENYANVVKTWKKVSVDEEDGGIGVTPSPPPPPPPPPPVVKHGYTQFGPENRFCKWWEGNLITTMGFTNPEETFNKSVNDDSLLKESAQKCNDNPECNFVSVMEQGDGGKVYTLFKDCPNHLSFDRTTNGVWRKDDPNVAGTTPPPDPPQPDPFKCGGNPNTQIHHLKQMDGNCDCSLTFDDEGLTDEGVAEGTCQPKQLAAILNDESISRYAKLYPKYMENGATETKWTFNSSINDWEESLLHDYTKIPGASNLMDKSAYKFTHRQPFNKQSRPYIIDEKKSGWTRKVYDNFSFTECANKNDRTGGIGFTWAWDGEPFLYDLRLFDDDPFDPDDGSHFRETRDSGKCIVYGDNTGEATDKKCVNDHNLHSDCYTVDKSKYGATYWKMEQNHAKGKYPTDLEWTGTEWVTVKRKQDLAHREWKKPKYWKGRNANYRDSTEA